VRLLAHSCSLPVLYPAPVDEECKAACPFSKVIYVMEDVDAASEVVQRRTGSAAGGQQQPSPASLARMSQRAMAAAAAAQRAAAASASGGGSEDEGEQAAAGGNDSGDEAGSRQGEGEEDDAKQQRQQGGSPASSSRRNNAAGALRHGDSSLLYGECDAAAAAGGSEAVDFEELRMLSKLKGAKGAIGPLPKGFGRGFMADDELNLAGLLNVLDGVVDTPGRIIVMTSNHPEKLDPALIRPGRINKQIYMGRIRAQEALQMVRHYFAACGSVGEAQELQLRQVLREGVLSPAELESMCAEYDSAAELVSALAAHPALLDAGAEGL
jgi:SpoVK/Ycf46/Vps4 family AAA+-type ATPase